MALLTVIPYLVIEVGFKGNVPHYINYILCIFPPYCLYYSIFRLSFAVFLKGGLSFSETFAFDDGGLGIIFIIMIAEIIFFILFLIVLDFCSDKIKNYIKQKYSKIKYSFDPELVKADDDVKREMDRINDLDPSDYPILIQHVWKVFANSKETTCNDFLFFCFCFCFVLILCFFLDADRDVCLGIPEGECFGLLGPNGAGKTTLIDILTGLEQPDTGNVFVEQTNMKNAFSSVYQYV